MARLLALFLLLLATLPAAAHDLRARALGSTTIELRFSDGTPMAFAPARIYGPGDAVPYLETTTDAAGRVSFVADRDGQWRAEAGDADGHVARLTVSVAGGVPAGTGRSLPDWLVALSLVGNIIVLARLSSRWRFRRPATTPVRPEEDRAPPA